jgi:endonuclease/exonuclease/phosphatase family metal-dependent hydrolase
MVTIGAWTYLALVVAIWVLLRLAGDRWWPATALAFGPRWLLLLPLPLLVPPAVIFRRGLVAITMAAVVALGPVMGFCVPWRSFGAAAGGDEFVLRVVTQNVGEGIDVATFVEFLRETEPDVVALQECSGEAPYLREVRADWYFDHEGELLIASRFPIVARAVAPNADNRLRSAMLRATLETPHGPVDVHCLHLYTLRRGFDAVIKDWRGGGPDLERVMAIRNEESLIASRFAKQAEHPAVALGDFNMSCESAVFSADWSTWRDAFAECGTGFGYTFGTRHIGLRIDHVLVEPTHWRIRSCRLGPGLHGQHRPLLAEVVMIGRPIR